ncbi:MAG: hypothetical protein PHY43_11445 [Verrucomicrobiales bacterium]|nr:hypothetical protein [Verrucomicrobiales bacterium]
MQANLGRVIQLLAAIVIGILFQPLLMADVVVLQNGEVITGNILQQDASGVLMQMEYGTFRYPPALIKEVKKEAAAAPHVSNNGKVIPDWAQIVTLLANNGWAGELTQVPATVINYGKFNNVPYVSFRCASGGYELNIFGDLNQPAAVQIGAMTYLKDNAAAKSNCVNFICSVLANAADRKMVRALNWNQKDVQKNGSMAFETLLPGEWGSYGGWWVSVYDTNALASAQASDADMLALAQPRVAAAQPVATAAQPAPAADATAPDSAVQQPAAAATQPTTTTTTTYGYYGWTAEELAYARRPVTPVAATPVANPVNPVTTDDRVYPRTYTRTGGTYGRRR